ncbi:hypothetical protein SKAU_G00355890 [Synaphobranchus kaupii]|uniref:Uncharacterized protein n=1 Tax=Synaphobranchus kaupii TaxID=118154 RepID=A0A9Q1IEG7_SYNKA|nr:hypothetical protein SKAU_G00355890 [Synaphobranchus kaupii]
MTAPCWAHWVGRGEAKAGHTSTSLHSITPLCPCSTGQNASVWAWASVSPHIRPPPHPRQHPTLSSARQCPPAPAPHRCASFAGGAAIWSPLPSTMPFPSLPQSCRRAPVTRACSNDHPYGPPCAASRVHELFAAHTLTPSNEVVKQKAARAARGGCNWAPAADAVRSDPTLTC